MKLDQQGNMIDDGYRMSCTWNNERCCGTHCLHFQFTGIDKDRYGNDKCKTAILLCAPHKVEIQLEE